MEFRRVRPSRGPHHPPWDTTTLHGTPPPPSMGPHHHPTILLLPRCLLRYVDNQLTLGLISKRPVGRPLHTPHPLLYGTPPPRLYGTPPPLPLHGSPPSPPLPDGPPTRCACMACWTRAARPAPAPTPPSSLISTAHSRSVPSLHNQPSLGPPPLLSSPPPALLHQPSQAHLLLFHQPSSSCPLCRTSRSTRRTSGPKGRPTRPSSLPTMPGR